jgi:hypothetical protein
VRDDKDYELFFIRKEEGRPFFNRALLRHIHLVEQFDELLAHSPEEDALFKIKGIHDKDLQLCAREIIRETAPYIDEFYRMGVKHKDVELIAMMNKVLMALMLAANPRNSVQTALGKTCTNYFSDFHLYFRSLLSAPEYKRFMEQAPPASERIAHSLINLSHALCAAFFMRSASKEDMRVLIRQLIEQGEEGEEVESPTHSPLSVWNVFLDEDAQIRNTLKYSPYGPLRNAIDVFNENRQLKGFDPIFQNNFPYSLYEASNDEINIGCLYLPCPILQTYIKKAEIIPEFLVFLKALGSGKRSGSHLLVNLQDRTSWQEHARCTALEELQKKPGYSALKVITLATGTDFYLQSDAYRDLEDAKEFIKQFKEQIESGGECGFYFPAEMALSKSFIHDTMEMIHDTFFGGKKVLLHKNRLDFIEIFYLFLILKGIEQMKPTTISFTSKDSIDGGAALGAEMFAFLQMMNRKGPFTEEEKDFMRWLFYTPALTIRQRAIDCQHLKRTLSALSIINAELEAHFADVVASAAKLFRLPFFKNLSLREF